MKGRQDIKEKCFHCEAQEMFLCGQEAFFVTSLLFQNVAFLRCTRSKTGPHERWNDVRCVTCVVEIYCRIVKPTQEKRASLSVLHCNLRYFSSNVFMLERTLDFLMHVLYTRECSRPHECLQDVRYVHTHFVENALLVVPVATTVEFLYCRPSLLQKTSVLNICGNIILQILVCSEVISRLYSFQCRQKELYLSEEYRTNLM